MTIKQYLTNNYFRQFLIKVCLCIFYLSAAGQKKDNGFFDIKIHGGQNGNLFTNGANLIGIITDDTTTSFEINASQGVISKLDKYMYFIDSLKKGKVIITIQKITNKSDTAALKKYYNVLVPKVLTRYNSLSPSPNISLGGVTNGKVKLDYLKKITELTINETYSIVEATFYIGITDLQIALLKSKYFDKNLNDLWKRISPNCVISVDKIKFRDKKGTIYTYPKTISITATE